MTANPGEGGGADIAGDGYSGGGADLSTSGVGGRGGSNGGDGEDSSTSYGGNGSGLDIASIPLVNVVVR